MTLHATIDYAADLHTVFAMLTDPEFQRRKIEATGALNHHVDIQRDAGTVTVVSKRTMPTERAPDVVRTMLGETVLVTQRDTWNLDEGGETARRGTLTVEIEGIPLKVNGRMRLDGGGERITEVVDTELSSRIPLVGPKIIDAARPLILSALKAERITGQAWLREREAEA